MDGVGFILICIGIVVVGAALYIHFSHATVNTSAIEAKIKAEVESHLPTAIGNMFAKRDAARPADPKTVVQLPAAKPPGFL